MKYRACFTAYSPTDFPFHVKGESIQKLIENIEIYLIDIYPMRKIVDGRLVKMRNSEAILLAAYENNNDITNKIKKMI
jgi:hypothetical protein